MSFDIRQSQLQAKSCLMVRVRRVNCVPNRFGDQRKDFEGKSRAFCFESHFLVEKNILTKKFWSKKIFGAKILVQKIFGPRTFWSKEILDTKKFKVKIGSYCLDIAAMDKYHQGKCHPDICLKKITFKVWSKLAK